MAVRALALMIPLCTSILFTILVRRAWPPPRGIAVLLYWGLLIASSIAVVRWMDKLAKRLLPLATLLRLSLIFPDQAPSRFKVALRASTVRNAEQRLAKAKAEGISDEPTRATGEVLELIGTLTIHDRQTRGHCERVRGYTDLIAEELGLPEPDRNRLRWAALLHDVGKLHVSTTILNKPGKPTEEEWEELKRHPADGARITRSLRGWLGEWAPAIEQHHERWDGSGYPAGLAGEGICLGARIVAVADAYEVMTATRAYKRPINPGAARTELTKWADRQFDPVVVRAFLNISLGRLRTVAGPLSVLAQIPLIGALPSFDPAGGLTSIGRQALVATSTATGVGALVVGASMAPAAPASVPASVNPTTATVRPHTTTTVARRSPATVAAKPATTTSTSTTAKPEAHPAKAVDKPKRDPASAPTTSTTSTTAKPEPTTTTTVKPTVSPTTSTTLGAAATTTSTTQVHHHDKDEGDNK
jgi:putative nucleotidyltransferase with HDIG domain